MKAADYYKPLYNFLLSHAYLIAIDESFYPALCQAGVDFENPPTPATKFFLKYSSLREKHGHEYAKLQCYEELAPFIYTVENELDSDRVKLYDKTPDPEVIAIEYKKLKKCQDAITLAQSLISRPENAEEVLNNHLTKNVFKSSRLLTIEDAILLSQLNFEKRKLEGLYVSIKGFEKISALVGGFNPGRVTFLLAKSGYGKTNLSLNLALNATQTMDVLYFNLEMNEDDVSDRLVSTMSDLQWSEYYKTKLTNLKRESKFQLFLTDGKEMSIGQIISTIHYRKKQNENLKFIVIDYDQKVDFSHSKDTPEWRAIQLGIRKLEDLAKELDFHLLFVAQLNREDQISSSHRAIFTAHTVLSFDMHNERPAVNNKIKHRHARGPRGVYLNYDPRRPKITEALDEIFEIDEKLSKTEKVRQLRDVPAKIRTPYSEN